MQLQFSPLSLLALVGLLATACDSETDAATPASLQPPSLWTADDVALTVFQIDTNGQILRSWPSGSVSGLALDPVDETLWTSKEGFNRIVQFSRTGEVLRTITGQSIDPSLTQPEGIAVSYQNGRLWIVDDISMTIYVAERDGTLVRTIPTSAYDPVATGPQAIASDPDGSLWVTDNDTDRVYNISRFGDLLSSFHTDAFSVSANNPQGIAVSPLDGTLWVTDRIDQRLYNLTREGAVISSIDCTAYGSDNPTGVTFDIGDAVPAGGVSPILASGASPDAAAPGSPVGVLRQNAAAAGGAQQLLRYGSTPLRGRSADTEQVIRLEPAAQAHATDAFLGWILGQCRLELGPGSTHVSVAGIWLHDRDLTLVGSPTSELVLESATCIRLDGESQLLFEGGLEPSQVTFLLPDWSSPGSAPQELRWSPADGLVPLKR